MKLSHTALNTFEACQLSYKLKYVDRVNGQVNSRNFLVGAVCDRLASEWFSEGCPRGWMQRRADQAFDKYINDNKIVWRDLAKSTLAKAGVSNDRAYLHQRLTKWIPKMESMFYRYKIVDLEHLQPQRYGKAKIPKHEDHTMFGTCDFFHHETRTIYELKMTQNKAVLNKDQLLFYAAIFTIADRKKVNKMFFLAPAMKRPVIEVDFTYYEVKGLLKRVLKAIKTIEEGNFVPCGKTRECFSCDFRGPLCPAWRGKDVDVVVTRGMREVDL